MGFKQVHDFLKYTESNIQGVALSEAQEPYAPGTRSIRWKNIVLGVFLLVSALIIHYSQKEIKMFPWLNWQPLSWLHHTTTPNAKESQLAQQDPVSAILPSKIPSWTTAATFEFLQPVPLKRAELLIDPIVDEPQATMAVLDKVIVMPKQFGIVKQLA